MHIAAAVASHPRDIRRLYLDVVSLAAAGGSSLFLHSDLSPTPLSLSSSRVPMPMPFSVPPGQAQRPHGGLPAHRRRLPSALRPRQAPRLRRGQRHQGTNLPTLTSLRMKATICGPHFSPRLLRSPGSSISLLFTRVRVVVRRSSVGARTRSTTTRATRTRSTKQHCARRYILYFAFTFSGSFIQLAMLHNPVSSSIIMNHGHQRVCRWKGSSTRRSTTFGPSATPSCTSASTWPKRRPKRRRGGGGGGGAQGSVRRRTMTTVGERLVAASRGWLWGGHASKGVIAGCSSFACPAHLCMKENLIELHAIHYPTIAARRIRGGASVTVCMPSVHT